MRYLYIRLAMLKDQVEPKKWRSFVQEWERYPTQLRLIIEIISLCEPGLPTGNDCVFICFFVFYVFFVFNRAIIPFYGLTDGLIVKIYSESAHVQVVASGNST